MKKRLIIFLIAILMVFSAYAQIKPAKYFIKSAIAKIKMITPHEAQAIMDKGEIIIIDVRTEKEFRRGTIPGAMHIPRGLLEFKVHKVITDPNQKIIVFCKTGGRGALATLRLKEMGYKYVYNIKGGFNVWKKAGLPVGRGK